jgi:5-methylcytosine-specific restriction endonuclease McrA
MSSILRKHCPTCDTSKPASDFHANRSRSDGLSIECKACACARVRAWRERNADRDKEIQRNNRERRRAKGVRHIAASHGSKRCPICTLEIDVSGFNRNAKERDGLQWCCRSCERINNQLWRDRNRDRVRALHRAWCYRNKDKELQRKARYRDLNRDKLREKHRQYSRINALRQRERVMRRNALKKRSSVGPVNYQRIWERDQGHCYICDQRVETQDCHYDHIIPLSKGGPHIESNIAVTHSWCNYRKGSRLVICDQGILL